mmetsp:Transcript_5807/g.9657  ORF Transcript_5807/g.9657 Transcript_5807/m.9657 type:complete len:204 (+) Transcript_5807:344-955(+)
MADGAEHAGVGTVLRISGRPHRERRATLPMAPSLLPPESDEQRHQGRTVRFAAEGGGANVWLRVSHGAQRFGEGRISPQTGDVLHGLDADSVLDVEEVVGSDRPRRRPVQSGGCGVRIFGICTHDGTVGAGGDEGIRWLGRGNKGVACDRRCEQRSRRRRPLGRCGTAMSSREFGRSAQAEKRAKLRNIGQEVGRRIEGRRTW